jgi:hypothetical protein
MEMGRTDTSMTTTTLDPYAAYLDGAVTPREAAGPITARLRTIVAHREALEALERELREQLSVLVAAHGEALTLDGYRYELTGAALTTSYGREDVERYAQWLIDEGYGPLAERLKTLQRHSARAGGLRVTKEKAT